MKALSYSSAQPANTDLLTGATIRKQLAGMPISNIRILDNDSSRGRPPREHAA